MSFDSSGGLRWSKKIGPYIRLNDLAVTHAQLGSIYRNAGDIDRALPHYRESIRQYESSNNLFGAGQVRFNVAQGLVQAGKLSDAREYARAAQKNRSSQLAAGDVVVRLDIDELEWGSGSLPKSEDYRLAGRIRRIPDTEAGTG